ncbi:MAG TPA: ATP-binding cassette domain-containing protein, partial [Acidimicrobiales bacterium]
MAELPGSDPTDLGDGSGGPPPPDDDANPAVLFHNAAVTRGGRTIWERGDFTIPHGALVVVIGPNGSGKTTLLQAVLGLQPLSAGSLEVLGAPPKQGDPRIGYVPQNYTATIGNAVRARDLVA